MIIADNSGRCTNSAGDGDSGDGEEASWVEETEVVVG